MKKKKSVPTVSTRISRRVVLALAGSLASRVALGCGEGPQLAEEDFSLDALIARIGRGDEDVARALVARARARGVPDGRLLAAAWMAPLRFGGLPSDVHAVLVLPAIGRLARAGGRFGLDASPCIAWALANASAWCSNARAPRVTPLRAASDADAIGAIRRGDLDAADAAIRGLAARAGTDRALALLTSEALEPREDVHASIYAAQLCRIWEHLARSHRTDAVAHVARYLARVPRIEGAVEPIAVVPGDARGASELAAMLASDPHMPLAGVTEAALLDALALLATEARLQDATPSGTGVHRTTHLDALAVLVRRASERAYAMGCALRSSLRSSIELGRARPESAAAIMTEHVRDARALERRVCSRMIARDSDEHAFKYWAALDALSEVVSPSIRADLWSGIAMLDLRGGD